MLIEILLFLLSITVILLGAGLFTNGVEWLGKRMNVSEGVVGSIFAAVGTALPETMIPVIAILFGREEAHREIGIGAILGAPLMLSCLTIPLLGIALIVLARMGRRTREFLLDYDIVCLDLRFFLIAYGLALLLALVPTTEAVRWAGAALLIVFYLRYLQRMFSRESTGHGPVEPLYFAKRIELPSFYIIGLQVLVGLACIIGGAHLFVDLVKEIAHTAGIPPLVLSTLIAPVATELPEKFNSLIWVFQRKDTLAVGNITGAMVFQGTFPVSVGLVGTAWHLSIYALASLVLALLAGAILYFSIRFAGQWRAGQVSLGILLYLAYGLVIFFV